MAKLKLDLEPDPEVTVIGISSHVNDYRLVLVHQPDHRPGLGPQAEGYHEEGERGRMATYSAYDHVDDDHARAIHLGQQPQWRWYPVRTSIAKPTISSWWTMNLAERHPDLLNAVRTADFVLTAFTLPFEQLRMGHH